MSGKKASFLSVIHIKMFAEAYLSNTKLAFDFEHLSKIRNLFLVMPYQPHVLHFTRTLRQHSSTLPRNPNDDIQAWAFKSSSLTTAQLIAPLFLRVQQALDHIFNVLPIVRISCPYAAADLGGNPALLNVPKHLGLTWRYLVLPDSRCECFGHSCCHCLCFCVCSDFRSYARACV